MTLRAFRLVAQGTSACPSNSVRLESQEQNPWFGHVDCRLGNPPVNYRQTQGNLARVCIYPLTRKLMVKCGRLAAEKRRGLSRVCCRRGQMEARNVF
jgi:hypothetical protein